MLKTITRLTPLAMNFISYGFGFLFAAEIKNAGGTGWQVSLPPFAGGLLYPLATWAVGKIITPKRIAPLLTASGIGILVCAAGTYFFRSLGMIVVWNLILLTAMTCYVVPAQLLLKRIQSNSDARSGTARATALYLFGVSIGQGAGPLICGHVTANVFLGICFLLIPVIVAGIRLTDQRYPAKENASFSSAARAEETDVSAPPRSVVAGWVIAGLLSLALSMMTASVTFRGKSLGLTTGECADALAIRSLAEAIVVFAFFFYTNWVNRAVAPILIVLAIASSEIVFSCGSSASALSAAAGIFGVALGAGLFYVSYHALLSSGNNGKFSIITEIVIGVTQFLGPACGMAATETTSFVPFLIAAAAATGVLLFLIFYMRRETA